MPWPFVPPDPDIPSPVLASTDGAFVAFPLTLTGMSPFDEQYAHRFFVDGQAAAVFLDRELDAAKHRWSGLGIARVRADGEATFKALYTPQDEVKATEVAVKAGTFPAKVVEVTTKRSGAKALFSIRASVPSSGRFQALAVPLVAEMPAFSSVKDYLSASAWSDVSASGHAEVVVRPDGIHSYGVLVVQGLPYRVEPASTVHREKLL